MATDYLQININDDLKNQVTKILADYGLSTTQAIELFLNQIVATKKVPFDFSAHQPNEKTILAMKELDNGGGKTYTNIDEWLSEYHYVANQDQ